MVAERSAPLARVLVCVDDPAQAKDLIYCGRDLAEQFDARWTVLYVERSRLSLFGEIQRDAVADALHLVEQLGGEATTIARYRTGENILAYAKRHGFTHIVTARPAAKRWADFLRPQSFQGALRRACVINIHIVAFDDERQPVAEPETDDAEDLQVRFDPVPYVMSLGLVAAATGVSAVLQRFIPLQALTLVYLVAVLLSATRYGSWPSLLAVFVSAAVYDYIFIPPLFSLGIQNRPDASALIFFSMVALVVSYLTAQNQRQAHQIAEHARRTDELYSFSRKIAGIVALEALLPVAAYRIAGLIRSNIVILLPHDDGGVKISCAYPPETDFTGADFAAAAWSLQNGQVAGRGTNKFPGVGRLFLPLQTPRGVVGVIGVDRQGLEHLSPGMRRLLDAVADQTAVAMEGILLADNVVKVRLQSEVERLRNALLISISHDLRTPLSSVIGALIHLKHLGSRYDEKGKEGLLSIALDEAERLNRFVGNLLDMTKLEAGGVPMKLEPTDISEVVSEALRHAGSLLSDRTVDISLPDDLPPVRADFTLLERVFFNLVDNAAKYTPSDTPIEIYGRVDNGEVLIEVGDHGDGIPPHALEAIFDKFSRLEREDRQRGGTGLGLPICRGFLEAMGGSITARNRQDGSGAIFAVRLGAESYVIITEEDAS